MKKIFRKTKSFTLVELIVAVSIFAVVAVLGMATFSMSMSSKSKIAGLNVVREEGNRIMAEIEEMVEKGNYTWSSAGSTIKGIGIYSGTPGLGWLMCDSLESDTGAGLYSRYVDSAGWRIHQAAVVGGGYFRISKEIYQNGSLKYSTDGWVNFSSDRVTVSGLRFWGYVRECSTSNKATKISVKFTVTSKEANVTGEVPSLTLRSTFTSGYPNPDQAGDSFPIVY